MRAPAELVVLIRGGGEMASAIAHRLHCSHFRVCLTETAMPLAVSRGTAFSEAVFDHTKTVDGETAELVPCSVTAIEQAWQRGRIPILIDAGAAIKGELKPDIIVDARSLKVKSDTLITDAPLVIGLGPGFYAGRDCHAVIETLHGHSLGRVILDGKTQEDNRTPVDLGGLTKGRVVWAEGDGIFLTDHSIGSFVQAHEVVATIGPHPIKAPVAGILRGLLRNGMRISQGAKVVEIDPVNDSSACMAIRDKWRVVADGVLEAIMTKINEN